MTRFDTNILPCQVLRRVIAELHSKYSKDVGSPRDKESAPTKSFFEIRLSGLLQTDDRQALREIVRQLHLEQSMEALQLGSFADCLAFVLSTLRAGSIESTPVVFILEDIDLFAQHPKQALLYNLFDIAQSSQNPIAVIGFTRRIVSSIERTPEYRGINPCSLTGLCLSSGETCEIAILTSTNILLSSGFPGWFHGNPSAGNIPL